MNEPIHKPRSTLRAFLRGEASGGIILMVAAALALIVANSPLAEAYESAIHAMLGPLSVERWINDALMALFFLLVGLEIKREMIDGQEAGGALYQAEPKKSSRSGLKPLENRAVL